MASEKKNSTTIRIQHPQLGWLCNINTESLTATRVHKLCMHTTKHIMRVRKRVIRGRQRTRCNVL